MIGTGVVLATLPLFALAALAVLARVIHTNWPPLWRRINADWGVALVLTPFALAIWVLFARALPGTPWVASDSGTYLGFAPYRTLLYPMLLRVTATVTDTPAGLVQPQLIAGLVATVAFAESAQRSIRNSFVTVTAGLLTLLSWPLLQYSVMLLTDYPFYALFTSCMAVGLAVLRDPRWGRLAGLAVLAATTIMLRPVGIIVLVFIPLLLLAQPVVWRRMAIAFFGPLIVLMLGISALNYWVFGFFSPERFSGWGMSANTLLLLDSDTPADHPRLRDSLVSRAAPYKNAFDKGEGVLAKYEAILLGTNPLADMAREEVLLFGRDSGLIELSDVTRQKRLLAWINGWSPLNAALGAATPAMADPTWLWTDGILSRLGRQARIHAMPQTALLALVNLRFSLPNIVQFAPIPTSFADLHPLVLDDGDLGNQHDIALPSREGMPAAAVEMFNAIATPLSRMRSPVIPGITVIAGLGWIGLGTAALLRRRRLRTDLGALAFLATCTLSYHLVVCFGQLPLPRFLIAVSAPAAMLLLTPILLASRQSPAGLRSGRVSPLR